MTEQIGMFDEVRAISTVDSKRHVGDEAVLAKIEMREASEALVAAERKWERSQSPERNPRESVRVVRRA